MAIVEVDLEKISKGRAVHRGVSVFVEMIMFYGLLLSIAMWDMHRRSIESKTQQDRLGEAEYEQERLEAAFDKVN